jgi:hypothetical protein
MLHAWDKKVLAEFSVGKRKGRKYLETKGVEVRMLSKLILNK